jgi:predicted nucleic acid-binding protein
MKIAEAFQNVNSLFVETAPLIYFVERNSTYLARMRPIIQMIDEGTIAGLSSVVTLLEVLTQPIKTGDRVIEEAYRDILLSSRNFTLIPINVPVAERASELRARYNLKTPDAIQIAAALYSGCNAVLTNDQGLRRVQEITILILDDLEV